MVFSKLVAAASALAVTGTAIAATPLALYPVKIGAETARYDRGRVTVNLELPEGAVEVRPLSIEKGQITLGIAVFNKSRSPGNFGIENVDVSINGVPAYLPTHDQLMAQARDQARDRKIAAALITGVVAGAASTMSNSYSYHQRVYTPHGAYGRTIRWEDDTPGIIGATAAVAAGAIVIHGIDRKLDYTLDRIDGSVLQATTVDPGNSFGGAVVVPFDKKMPLPAEIRMQIEWNGTRYPLAFRLSPQGIAVPRPFPATPRGEAIPVDAAQPPHP